MINKLVFGKKFLTIVNKNIDGYILNKLLNFQCIKMFYLIFIIARDYLLKIYNTVKVLFTGKNEEPELRISRNLISG